MVVALLTLYDDCVVGQAVALAVASRTAAAPIAE
jgi:hypothetical protein